MDSTDRCDQNYQQCKYIRKSEMGDVVAFTAITFATGLFFFLGMRVQPTKDFSKLKNGMQTFFFMVGFWLLILDIGIAETVVVSTGASENTHNLITTAIQIMSYMIYVVMFLLFLSYLWAILVLMIPNKK